MRMIVVVMRAIVEQAVQDQGQVVAQIYQKNLTLEWRS